MKELHNPNVVTKYSVSNLNCPFKTFILAIFKGSKFNFNIDVRFSILVNDTGSKMCRIPTKGFSTLGTLLKLDK